MGKKRALTALGILVAVTAAGWGVSRNAIIVRGSSMSPTYRNWEALRIVPAERLERGDVVVIRNERGTFLKRVALIGGDPLFSLRRANGDWDPILTPLPRHGSKTVKIRCTRIPADSVFVLGDALPRSEDSRTWGPVDRGDIVGKVFDQRPPPIEVAVVGHRLAHPAPAAVKTFGG